MACLGPVTQAGCGALCPSFDRGCYGCFGPQDSANTSSLADRLASAGMTSRDIQRLFSTYNVGSQAFGAQAQREQGGAR